MKITKEEFQRIGKEFDDHNCMPKITGFKTIKYADSYTVQDSQNRKIITIRDMNGTVYDFIEIPEDKEQVLPAYRLIS